MAVRVQITSPDLNHTARVTHENYLKVGPAEYNNSAQVTLAVDNQGYTLIEPRAGYRAIIDGFYISTDRNVGANGANIILYESDAAQSATETRVLFSIDMLKQTSQNMTVLKLAAKPGVWINAKTDDAGAAVTVLYYYVSTNGD